MLSEFYRIGFRKRLYGSIADLQPNSNFNCTRPHQGRWCFGKTPMRDAKPITEEKNDRCLITGRKPPMP